MPNRFTTAYAGSGTITPENAKFHLDQFLPEDPEPGVSALGLVIVPEHVARRQAGLKHVIAWLDGELGKDNVARAGDLVEALLARREYEENGETYTDDLVLVMLYDPDSEEDVTLAQQAHDAGIRVVNLCAAADDLLLDSTELFPAEEPVADQAVAAAVDEPAEETPPWDENPAARAIRQATDAAVAAAEAAREAAPTVEVASPSQGVSVTFTLSQEAVNALADAILLAMDRQASEADVRLGTTGSEPRSCPPTTTASPPRATRPRRAPGRTTTAPTRGCTGRPGARPGTRSARSSWPRPRSGRSRRPSCWPSPQ